MLWSLFVVLVVALILGALGFQVVGGFVQVIIVLALIVIGLQLFNTKSTAGR